MVPPLSLLLLLLTLSSLSKSKRYFWKYSPTSGIDPFLELRPINTHDHVAPSHDGDFQYPGSRVGHMMVDCTIDENHPTVCLFGGRNSWFSRADLWSLDVLNQKWSFRFTGLTEDDLHCQLHAYCRVSDLLGASFPSARGGFDFVRLSDPRARIFGGYGYAVNGTQDDDHTIDESGHLGDIWDLDIASWTWSYVSIAPGSEKWVAYNSSIGGEVSYPCGRSSAAVWNLGNDLILQGGSSHQRYCDLSLTWRFDDLENSWTELGASGNPWDTYGYTIWKSHDDARLYAFGADQSLSLFQIYTVSDNSWEVIRYPEDTPIVADETEGGGSRPGGSENRNVFFVPTTLFPTESNPGLFFLIGGQGYPAHGVDGEVTLLAEMWTFNSEVGEASAWELQQLTNDGSELITTTAENSYTSWDGPNAFPVARVQAAIVFVKSARKAVYYGGFVPSPDETPCGYQDCIGADLWVLGFPLCVGDECLGVVALSAGLLSGVAMAFGVVVFVGLLVVLFCCCCVKRSEKILFVFDDNVDPETAPVSSEDPPLSNRKLDFHEALLEEKRLACEAVANLKINRDLFQILMEEIELTKQLAAGGSDSIVYKALWKGRVVCFKVYKTILLNASDQNFSQFEQELEVISGLNHPAIVRFWGCCLTPPRVGIVMEFCSLGELGAYISRGDRNENPIPLEERLRFLEEVADGMEFLHSRAVVHRLSWNKKKITHCHLLGDLKCANILISDDVHAKIIDFGLSRTVSVMYSDLTRKIGTLWYMSPEMSLGKKYTEKTDVYSYAIVAFEVAEKNFRPFGDTPTEMVPIRAADDEMFRPKFSGDSDKSPGWLRELLVECWAEDPEQRPSFEEILRTFKDSAVSEEEEEGGEWDSEEEEEEGGEWDSEEEGEAESG